jgi:hypothetical protein
LFSSLIYLDQAANKRLLSGTANSRHKEFESIFDLELIDQCASRVDQRLSIVLSKQATIDLI